MLKLAASVEVIDIVPLAPFVAADVNLTYIVVVVIVPPDCVKVMVLE